MRGGGGVAGLSHIYIYTYKYVIRIIYTYV